VVGSNREQCNIPGTLDSLGDFSLMPGAVSGDTARNNLAALRDEITECAWLLIIYRKIFLCTETTYLAALKGTLLARAARAV
jgi:hypothetical protein